MKYSQQQKSIVKNLNVNRFIKGETFKKDKRQIYLQKTIDNHYPEPERYEIFESSISK